MVPSDAAGLVGGVQFAMLPAAGAGAAAVAVLLAQAPALAALWRRPSRQLPGGFTGAVAYALLCGFVWGYHVHEKAILMVRCLVADYIGSPWNLGIGNDLTLPSGTKCWGAHTTQ